MLFVILLTVLNNQKSESMLKCFKIPIKKYEEDMNTEASKEKKKEILDLFMNSNKLCSEEEFIEIKENLHKACKIGDVELIKIYLSESIKNDTQDLIFKIDKASKTASLINTVSDNDQVIIPRTVNHESTDYLITSISGIGKQTKSIKFDENSAVETIHNYSFAYNSKIEEIYFPSSLKELKEEWCNWINKLTKIIISPLNGQFIIKDGKYLLGKTDPNSDEFDNFLFAFRNIKEISIPSNIKIISPHAFASCSNLTKVEIPTNSKLEMIDKFAFTSSLIESILIPPKVTKICDHAFSFCNRLTKVEIPENSKLQTIESGAFSNSKIEEIYFPSSLKELKKEWCNGINKLTKIIISPLNGQFIIKDDKYLLGKTNPNSDEFDNLLFAFRNIKKISIPSNIKIISPHAFENCEDLIKVEIPTNSNLEIIGRFAFASSLIESIFIPPKVSKICDHAFSLCNRLTKVEIPENSKLQTIESGAFSYSEIEEIYFPSSLKELKKEWCNGINKLTKIIISPLNGQFIIKDDKYLLGKTDPNSDEFDNFLFAFRNIEEISIPSNIKIISPHSFASCSNLTKVEIPTNSNLETIGKYAFYYSKIKSIFIPSKVSKICEYAFDMCDEMQKVEFATNSNLQKIGLCAFNHSKIKSIFIPSKVSKICINAFTYCFDLAKIEIPTDSNLQTIECGAFSYTNIEEIVIPSNVSKIGQCVFKNCENLKIVKFAVNSSLRTICKKAFFCSTVREIYFPDSLKELEDGAIMQIN